MRWQASSLIKLRITTALPLALLLRPGVELRAKLKSISHRCHLFEVAFVWELTKETIHLPLDYQGGIGSFLLAPANGLCTTVGPTLVLSGL